MIQNLNKSFAFTVDDQRFFAHVAIVAISKQTDDSAHHRNLNIAICIERPHPSQDDSATIFLQYRSRELGEMFKECISVYRNDADPRLTVGTWTIVAAETVLQVLDEQFECKASSHYDVFIELRDAFASVLEY